MWVDWWGGDEEVCFVDSGLSVGNLLSALLMILYVGDRGGIVLSMKKKVNEECSAVCLKQKNLSHWPPRIIPTLRT